MSMNDQERQVITDLFGRLEEVERNAPPRDAEAEAFIQQRIARQAGAPYYMAQTLVMQEMALQQAQQRIEELERSASSQRPAGGLLSSLFGGGQPNQQRSGRALAAPDRTTRAPVAAQPGRGGGFLAGAAQTAMGVAGGVLLANALSSLMSGGEAEAAAPDASEAHDSASEASNDEGADSFDSDFGGDEF